MEKTRGGSPVYSQWLVEEESHRATVGAYAALTCAHIGGGWVSICKKPNLVIGRLKKGGQGRKVAGWHGGAWWQGPS